MIYIRVDCNDIIATGHLMRCLVIADAARKLGEETEFIIADSNPVELFVQRGYKYHILNSIWKKMESELDILNKFVIEKKFEVLLVDSYQVTTNYLNIVRKYTKIVYFDELNLFHYPLML